MSATVSISEDRARFDGYHVAPPYLRSLNHDGDYIFINLEAARTSIALMKIGLPDGRFDLATPVGFQPSLGRAFWTQHLDTIYDALSRTGAVTGFLQTKDDVADLGNGLAINTARYRTNYCIDLTRGLDELQAAMARDCRSRLKRAVRTVEYDVRDDGDIAEFSRCYAEIAADKAFPPSYVFSEHDFRALQQVPGIDYLELRSAGAYLSGGFFAAHNGEVDYLFGANSRAKEDTIRLLVWEAIRHFKARGAHRLCLGGGIREEDSLAQYKLRFGSGPRRCTTVRMVLDRETAEAYANQRLTPAWYQGYFPPYRRPAREAVHGS